MALNDISTNTHLALRFQKYHYIQFREGLEKKQKTSRGNQDGHHQPTMASAESNHHESQVDRKNLVRKIIL